MNTEYVGIHDGIKHGPSTRVAQLLLPDTPLVKIQFLGICDKCRHFHHEDVDPNHFIKSCDDWKYKHRHCELEDPKYVQTYSLGISIPRGFDDRNVEKLGRAPWWMTYKPNADIKIAYAADAAFTLTLSALNASSTLVFGREATSVDNTSNKYLDYRISGSFISGTSPTAGGEARLSGVAPIEDTPTWPDVFDGTDSDETITNTAMRDKLPILWSGDYSTSSNITYPITNALTIAQAFGIVPSAFTIFFSHSMTAALKTDTNNNNSIFYKGVYATST